MKFFLKSLPFLAALFLPGLFLTGCNTTKKALVNYENHLITGEYAVATTIAVENASKGGKDQLLWRLLAGNGYMLQAEATQGIEQLDLAEDVFITNDQQSVFSQGASDAYAMLTNDRAFAYNGLGQDRIFCCLYKAVEYASSGNVDAARTEFNRAADHQENWLYERRRDIEAADKKLNEEAAKMSSEKEISGNGDRDANVKTILGDADFAAQLKAKCGYDPQVSGNLSSLPESAYTNVYLSHLCGVFRWINGDGGRNYLRDAARFNDQNPVVAEDFHMVDRGVVPRNQVWIYIEDGLCPCREEWRLDLPLALIPFLNRYAAYAGMALPYLVYRANACPGYYLQTTESRQDFTVLENVDRLIKTEYDVYLRGALKREIARTLIKVGTQVALGIAAENTRDSSARFALQVAMYSTGAAAAATTSADLRSWVSLPKTVFLQRVSRPANGRIDVVGVSGAMTEVLQLNIPEGNTIVWVRKLAGASRMVAKVMSF